MKLIVGLGNPGRKYEGTRHNIGFDVLAEVARLRAASPAREKFEGLLAEAQIGGERCLLLLPQTFMNLSGSSVGKTIDFYRIAVEDLLVVCDDFNLPLGKLRFRPQGSAGGQKGLDDILRRMGTPEVARLRLGIGPVPERWDAVDFVLSKFTKDEGALVEETVSRAAKAVGDWVTQGIGYCMNEYNG